MTPYFIRTVSFLIEAATPEEAEQLWEDNGPECAAGVEVLEVETLEVSDLNVITRVEQEADAE